MARRSGEGGGAALAILLVASTLVAVLSRPAAALSDEGPSLNATGGGGKLSFDYHAVSCPHLVTIVRSCFRSNNGRYGGSIVDVTAAAADEGSAGAIDNTVDVAAGATASA
ncbi:hypothetical protein E2562_033683 [Oryza meyeriana var. granulata]|uniref:Uncharacterized protein n=1 Tax=Oryza meyeriana var. granulata TaxID=110450 RepID=A0A6G1DTV6_9ORYZ|nr:hypothetical protein E2562_033683 [Oryza meyeriana var. granulata]